MTSRLQRLLLRTRHVHWVLADQMLVSGCNFVLAIIYARALGPTAFGIYALITAAQQYFVSVSVSLVANPLVTRAPHLENGEERTRLIAASLSAQFVISSALALLALVGLSLALASGAAGISGLAVLGLAASSFALPLLEWCRKLCFLKRDGATLVWVDALTYLPILIAAFLLAQAGSMTLDLGVLLWGAASVPVAIGAAVRLRIPCALPAARSFMIQNWRLARDFIVPFQAHWLGSQGIVYLAVPVVGTAGIGAYRSISGLLGFTNAIGTTLDNMMPIRFAEVYRAGGSAPLRKYAIRFAAGVIGVSTLLLPLAFFAEPIVRLLLGSAYSTYAQLIWPQAFYILILFVSKVAIYHDRARLQTKRIAVSALIGSAVSTLLVILLTSEFGVIGLAWSTVLGALTSFLYLVLGMADRGRGG
ncbi:oligosaccharide flippase family protein [Accumulibacter sp.]|uniref:oligosaccharide flippase family protein n=1 Tax=Accumulibacter sp. TaxID=2053492 RepID=UPI001AD05582|nr:oligosaccharide flippase family protein [Accumulibacter sp.]MBN8455596.1 oligosaccharide flippase family protein [Accumulibacter sp.]MBO3705861.1 oligosaccharide flippase family protein [Candidatus Accumulibacter conexus]